MAAGAGSKGGSRGWWRGAYVVLPLVALAGCSTAYHREQVDKDVYALIAAREQQVLGHPTGFSVDTPYSARPVDQIPAAEIVASREAQAAYKLDLHEALRLAVAQSRVYQSRREDLYLAGLALSTAKHHFAPQLTGTAQAQAERTATGEQTGSTDAKLGISELLTTGGNLSLALANDLTRFYTGDPRAAATNLMTLNFAQPLLRGAGSRIAAESLTQAQRDLIYAVRDFTRYQTTFAVDIASQYYRLLQQKDTVRNNYDNYRNLTRVRERAEALTVDRLPAYQADQARQDELSARNAYLQAVAAYQASLDDFKQTLGLPIASVVSLADHDLADLSAQGLQPLELPEEGAVRVALARRFDLLNARDKYADAARKVAVAADALGTSVDLFASASLQSEATNRVERFRPRNVDAVGGVKLDLPLDRVEQRNSYRATIITFERELRTLGRAADTVTQDVRRDRRNLAQARAAFDIQSNAVTLAQKRVDGVTLLVAAGRAETRDELDAQSALVSARNALTATVVDYHLARLSLLRDLELLHVSPAGFVEDPARAALETPAAEPLPAVPANEVPSPAAVFGD